jgi:hypothetical protein
VPPTLDGLELLELDLGGEPAYVPRFLPGGKTTWSHSSQALAERCPTLWKRRATWTRRPTRRRPASRPRRSPSRSRAPRPSRIAERQLPRCDAGDERAAA